jgi:aspartyl-tRNA(Asn)/glutamyl-tRNA(Gln) amidotransferase subunit C
MKTDPSRSVRRDMRRGYAFVAGQRPPDEARLVRSSATLATVPVKIDVDHVARLARLALTDEERERFRQQLVQILEAAERVREVAAEDVPPTSQPVPLRNVLRDDSPRPSLTQEEALAGAPEVEAGRFKVPRIIEGE